MGKARHLPVVGSRETERTDRTDRWWLGPALTFAGLATFVVYTTWAAIQGTHYYAEPYLSPFYSPVLFHAPAAGAAPASHAWFGAFPAWWPSWLRISPAVLVLAFPGGFRFTCYYYRKAYYRSFAGSPPGCAVRPLAARRWYRGETGLLRIQNFHRYLLYFALLFLVVLGIDAARAFVRDGELGIGVGSVVLTINVVLLAGYTLGCHSLRHLIGGRKDCMSCGRATLAYGAWKRASWFNAHHMGWAWASLAWVMLSDLYVRLLSMGAIRDLHTW